MNEIITYEELSMNAHPAIKTQVYDGWILRFANGCTNRANSVNMLYPSRINLEEKINFCESIYELQELAIVFKMTPLSVDILDNILERKDYKKITPTNVMVKPLEMQNNFESKTIITDEINEAWQKEYFKLNDISDKIKIQTHKIIQANIINKTLCASIIENGKMVACGLCVIEREFAGLFDIVVDSDYRGKGRGFEICNSLLISAFEAGAKFAYLQVVADNTQAAALYNKLGFKNLYQYWYRVKGNYQTS